MFYVQHLHNPSPFLLPPTMNAISIWSLFVRAISSLLEVQIYLWRMLTNTVLRMKHLQDRSHASIYDYLSTYIDM